MAEKYPTDRESLERDCDVEFVRASGHGGQNRNKVETGVRLTHRPTGTVVMATERRSQAQNREAAFARMAAKLDELQHEEEPRAPSRLNRTNREERHQAKRRTSQIKRLRAAPAPEE
jgi:protein subunit release factor B